VGVRALARSSLRSFRRDAIEGLRQSLEDGARGRHANRRSLYELDAEPSAEDSAILQSLMSVGSSHERMRFLG
jgi:hypothetical protein